jgi:hypothetical protein
MNIVIDWDLAALLLAALAVLLRLLECPRASGVVSGLTVLSSSLAGYQARRRREALAARGE